MIRKLLFIAPDNKECEELLHWLKELPKQQGLSIYNVGEVNGMAEAVKQEITMAAFPILIIKEKRAIIEVLTSPALIMSALRQD